MQRNKKMWSTHRRIGNRNSERKQTLHSTEEDFIDRSHYKDFQRTKGNLTQRSNESYNDNLHKIGNINKENYASHSITSDSLWYHRLYLARTLCPWNSLGKNIRVGCYSLLQGISWPRDLTQVSPNAGRFLTVWATREALNAEGNCKKNQMEIWTWKVQ